MSNRGDLFGRHSDVDEGLEPALLGDDPKRAVPGVDQLDGSLDDPLQHHRKVEGLNHGLRGAQQGAEPVLRLQHVAGAIHQLVERAIQLGPGLARDGS
ncbi:hypothetical protein [Agromyces humatus]|uniref:hypothetical protein n=1 Tax=Agromyces humatus TaxID=279573 RepID=UPI001E394914|nr:hypothetical protein [Agromyces humatus]